MSIATLKRKTISKQNLSGRGKAKFAINKSSCGNPSWCFDFKQYDSSIVNECDNDIQVRTGPGGGFSINGRHRNIGRVGQNMLMSKGLSRSKNITASSGKRVPEYIGGGGQLGKYKRAASGKYGIACCNDDTKLVKPSVLSTKGMLAYKNRWIKRNIPNDVLIKVAEAEGFDHQPTDLPTRNNTAQVICNNWVQETGTGYIKTRTQGQYIEDRIKPRSQICNPNRYSDVPRENQPQKNIYNCMPCAKPCRSCDYHIGGKYFPPTPFSKQTTVIPSSSSHTTDLKYYKGFLQGAGWTAPWPKSKSTFTCMNDQKQILADVVRRMIGQRSIDCFKISEIEVEQDELIDSTPQESAAGFKKKYLI